MDMICKFICSYNILLLFEREFRKQLYLCEKWKQGTEEWDTFASMNYGHSILFYFIRLKIQKNNIYITKIYLFYIYIFDIEDRLNKENSVNVKGNDIKL